MFEYCEVSWLANSYPLVRLVGAVAFVACTNETTGKVFSVVGVSDVVVWVFPEEG